MNVPEGWKEALVAEMDRRFEVRAKKGKLDDDALPIDDTQIGIEFAIDFIDSLLTAAPTPPAQDLSTPVRNFRITVDSAPSNSVDREIRVTEVERVADIPRVSEALSNFAEDTTGDNGAEVVRAILECVAPEQELQRELVNLRRISNEACSMYQSVYQERDKLREAAEYVHRRFAPLAIDDEDRKALDNLRTAWEGSKYGDEVPEA